MTLIAWKGNPSRGQATNTQGSLRRQKSQGRPPGRAFAFPGMTKLHVSRKPWYSAQTSYQPPAITTQIETSLILNTQQIGHPAGCHRCRGPSWVWPQHCPLYISPVPFPVRTGESPILQLKLLPLRHPPWWPSHSESVPQNPQLGPGMELTTQQMLKSRFLINNLWLHHLALWGMLERAQAASSLKEQPVSPIAVSQMAQG